MAALAFASFTGFLAIVVLRVWRADLTIVVVIGLTLAAYDLWRQLRPRQRRR
jgi:hypothetical protein